MKDSIDCYFDANDEVREVLLLSDFAGGQGSKGCQTI